MITCPLFCLTCLSIGHLLSDCRLNKAKYSKTVAVDNKKQVLPMKTNTMVMEVIKVASPAVKVA